MSVALQLILLLVSASFSVAAHGQENIAIGGKTWDAWRIESSRLFVARDLEGSINAEKNALAIAEKSFPNDPRIVKSLQAMATANHLLGRENHAIPLYERAIKIAGKSGETALRRRLLLDVADAYKAVGRDSDAKKALERAKGP